MKTETERALYKVQSKLNECRAILDNHMYCGEMLPATDLAVCRKVYESICKTLDLL
jgi:hypothetical protein